MRSQPPKGPLWMRAVIGVALGLVVRLWLATLRLHVEIDPAAVHALGRRPVVLVFWHGQQLALLRWATTQRIAALVSRSRDGELMARALPLLGIAVARGSSSRGGAEGLRGIVRKLRAGYAAAFAVDGPRGPARIVRATRRDRVGAVAAAELGGGTVVAMAAACSASWIVEGSWDRFEVPKPFARVCVVLGAPLAPNDATPHRLSETLEAACRDAAARVGSGSREPRRRLRSEGA